MVTNIELDHMRAQIEQAQAICNALPALVEVLERIATAMEKALDEPDPNH